MSRVRVAVAGAGGRMGQRNLTLLAASPKDFEIVGALEHPLSPRLGDDVGPLIGKGPIGVKITPDPAVALKRAQVIIDFTTPEASLGLIHELVRRKVALVLGTTGIKPDGIRIVKKAAGKIPVVMAPNFSIGVNVQMKLLEQAAKLLGSDYDIEIVEMHHNQKKDAPSGTALGLAQVLCDATGRDLAKDAVYARHGDVGARTKREIGIQTLRGGDVVGEHTVYFAGAGERIEVTHRATNRDNFAGGAVRSAKWVASKKPGLYDMQDVLGLKNSPEKR